MHGRIKRRKQTSRHLKPSLLSFAVLVFLFQATLPWLLTNCPVYAMGPHAVSATAETMPPDCAMMAGMPGMQPAGQTLPASDHKTDHTRGTVSCPLCDVSSPAHGYVVAGLIALPPSAPVETSVFIASFSQVITQPHLIGFSARAPPSESDPAV